MRKTGDQKYDWQCIFDDAIERGLTPDLAAQEADDWVVDNYLSD